MGVLTTLQRAGCRRVGPTRDILKAQADSLKCILRCELWLTRGLGDVVEGMVVKAGGAYRWRSPGYRDWRG